MEILFPAGSMQHIDVSIRERVDAVYGGFKQWNSRDKANNFSLREYVSVISKLRKHNIKFYLTLNTQMLDEDIKDIINTIRSKNLVLPDAFIAADVGLIQQLKSNFPSVPIHLSTQFGVHNSDDAKFAETLGAERMILSRELTSGKIKEISQKTKLETECFVYGSQCISFSGQCYFSSLLNGGSGNRGKCEIFCRDKYRVNDKIGDLLYVPDLNCNGIIKNLPYVMCWKLEGRKRNPEEVGKYVHDLKQGKITDNQTGYAYGVDISKNKLFNKNHTRSNPLIYASKYNINGGNISLDIKSENGFIAEITYIDSQGQGTKFSKSKQREFVDFEIDDFSSIFLSKFGLNLHKVSCNENLSHLYIDKTIKEQILTQAKIFEQPKHNNILIDISNLWLEFDDIKYLDVLSKKYQDMTLVYNINSVENLQKLAPISNKKIIYKLPMFNFENINLDEHYRKLENQRVLFTHIGQIKSFESIELAEKITDYTIHIWNKSTLNYLKLKGFDAFSASPELSFAQNESIFGTQQRNYILYGRLPLVYTRACFRHLFDCKKCDLSKLKTISNVDKSMGFDVKCYREHRVILAKNPILNIYPDSGDKASFRVVATGMTLAEVEKILETPDLMKQNSYICNMQTIRR